MDHVWSGRVLTLCSRPVMPDENRKPFIDKLGGVFHIDDADIGDFPAVVEMYDNFIPMAVTQGLPPSEPQTRHQWVKKLLNSGANLVAWHEQKIVGHAALIMEPTRSDGEYLIFVEKSFRNRGVGTELTVAAMDRATSAGLTSVWLTVEALNFRAIKLYRKIGFVFCDTGERERTMILKL